MISTPRRERTRATADRPAGSGAHPRSARAGARRRRRSRRRTRSPRRPPPPAARTRSRPTTSAPRGAPTAPTTRRPRRGRRRRPPRPPTARAAERVRRGAHRARAAPEAPAGRSDVRGDAAAAADRGGEPSRAAVRRRRGLVSGHRRPVAADGSSNRRDARRLLGRPGPVSRRRHRGIEVDVLLAARARREARASSQGGASRLVRGGRRADAADVEAVDVQILGEDVHLDVHDAHAHGDGGGGVEFLAADDALLPTVQLRARPREERGDLLGHARVSVVRAPAVRLDVVKARGQREVADAVGCEGVGLRPAVAFVHGEHELRPSLLTTTTTTSAALGKWGFIVSRRGGSRARRSRVECHQRQNKATGRPRGRARSPGRWWC